ncbi:hypothetical protein MKW98_000038 [Papaver atlanticum]|uniref:Serine/threonine-protein kinase BSK1-like TPR repeats domain-containing protein n=1 Tax=Papaver atlanticum TaxID=357466 RepID=A0AAD4S8R8_9MAGN|nr:hypothetical protein MKW98_000038 [Papaver atlanticum]
MLQCQFLPWFKDFLKAAHAGELNRLKQFALELDEVLGNGIPEILENIIDGEGRGAIHCAAAGGSVEVLKYLIEEIKLEIDVKDGKGETPLSWTAIEGRLAAVDYLLKLGANPEIPDELDCSPLHHAAMKGHKEIIPLLLSKGVNVDVMNEFGSPLLYASALGYHDTVKVLLDHGANQNVICGGTVTPLHASMYSQSCQCAEQLLKGGADPNGGPNGIKPLPIAAEMGLIQIIKLLVEAGADPNIIDIHGLKPIEFAAIKSNRRGVEILFPVTSPIPSYVDWSINGIMKHVTSKKFEIKMICQAKENFPKAKSMGTSAFQRKKYSLAIYWYSKALNMKPGDAAVLSNRSLCYVYLNKGDRAFEDAAQCVLARPDWPKAYYRAGVALKLMNRIDDAADVFFNGLKLDPENKELENASRLATTSFTVSFVTSSITA